MKAKRIAYSNYSIFKDLIKTKAKVKNARTLLRPVRYSVDLVVDGKRHMILVEGYFHRWFVDAKTQLQAVVECPDGYMNLIKFNELWFID